MPNQFFTDINRQIASAQNTSIIEHEVYMMIENPVAYNKLKEKERKELASILKVQWDIADKYRIKKSDNILLKQFVFRYAD